MTVKVVTDSSADIPPGVAEDLGITVVPLYISVGSEVYRDGIDIEVDRIYYMLAHGHAELRTSTPSPGDFARVYNQLAAQTDEILSIQLSDKYSGTYNAAKLGKDYVQGGCRVEVIDSKSVSMGCGLVAIVAARAAKAGASLEQLIEVVQKAILHTHLLGMVANLKYILGGKRLFIPGAQIFLAKLGRLVRAKLVGEIYEAGKIQGTGVCFTEAKAFDQLERCLAELSGIEEMAILYADNDAWARDFAGRIAPIFPEGRMYFARLGCVTAIHAGPKAMAIALIEGDK
jgi:DegV family protein with EDD domain